MAKEILTADNIILNAKPRDKWDAIRMCGEILVNNGYVRPEYIEDMYEREKTASVYIGNHIAIPHGQERSEHNIYESGISVVQVPEGVRFGDTDEEIAYVFFGIAGKNNTHLDILGNIAIVCSDLDNVMKIKETKDKQEILDILGEIKEL